jgi:hypothetical protein
VAPLLYAFAMTAPVVPAPTRNKLGIAALILVLVTYALPIIGFIVFVIASIIEGAEGDDIGYAVLGAFFVTAGLSAVIAPIAILGIVLGVISLFRHGQRKVQGILAIVLGIVPAAFVIGLPATIDSFF